MYKVGVETVQYCSDAAKETSNRLSDVIDYVKAKCRGKFVDSVTVRISYDNINITFNVQNRGTVAYTKDIVRGQSKGYPFTEDGLHNAYADYVRQRGSEDPDFLDTLQRMLGLAR